MNKKLTQIAIFAAFITPALALAVCPGPGGPQTICGILTSIDGILRTVIPTLMVIATVVFLWGVIRYITSGGDEEKLTQAKQFIIFGLVGLFIMVAIWGIVRALVNTFQVGGGGIPPGPGQL